MSADNILTFQKHKRFFPFKSVYFGMIVTLLINGLFGFPIGYSEGTDNFDGGPLPKGMMGFLVEQLLEDFLHYLVELHIWRSIRLYLRSPY